jgi:hypothetical protein
MDISARATSLTDRPQRAIWVTSVRTRSEARLSAARAEIIDAFMRLSRCWQRALQTLWNHPAAPPDPFA